MRDNEDESMLNEVDVIQEPSYKEKENVVMSKGYEMRDEDLVNEVDRMIRIER